MEGHVRKIFSQWIGLVRGVAEWRHLEPSELLLDSARVVGDVRLDIHRRSVNWGREDGVFVFTLGSDNVCVEACAAPARLAGCREGNEGSVFHGPTRGVSRYKRWWCDECPEKSRISRMCVDFRVEVGVSEVGAPATPLSRTRTVVAKGKLDEQRRLSRAFIGERPA